MGPEVEPGRAVARNAVLRGLIQETDALRNPAARSVTDWIKATSETGSLNRAPHTARAATPPFGRFAMWRSRILRVVMRCSPRCASSRASGVTSS
jgi:hypothetical protein